MDGIVDDGERVVGDGGAFGGIGEPCAMFEPVERRAFARIPRDIGQAFEQRMEQPAALCRAAHLGARRRAGDIVRAHRGRCQWARRARFLGRGAVEPFGQRWRDLDGLFSGRLAQRCFGRTMAKEMTRAAPFAVIDRLDAQLLEGAANGGVPALGMRHALGLRPERTADDQAFLGAGERDIEEPPMFLELSPGGQIDRLGERSRRLPLARPKNGNGLVILENVPIHAAARAARGIDRGIGEDDERGLKPLGAVRRHHAYGIERRGWITDDLDIAAIEPVDEQLQRRRRIAFKLERGVQQFLDRIARLRPQPRQQLAPRIDRTGEQVFEEAVRRGEIGLAEDLADRLRRIALKRTRIAQMAVEASTLGAFQPVLHQLLLRPADDRRDEQPGEIEIVFGLEREADGGEEIAHDERRVEPEAIDARNGHPLGIKARDDERGQLAAAADEDQNILRAKRTPLAFEPERFFEPVADLTRKPGGEASRAVRQPAFVALDLVVIAAEAVRRYGVPERDDAGAGNRAFMRFGARHQAKRIMTEIVEQRIDQFEHGFGGAEGFDQREIEQIMPDRFRLPREIDLRRLKIDRIGALKAENRLFIVADRKDGADAIGLGAIARKEFARQRRDDGPLLGIGVLRLVDKDMIGRLIELEADPVGHARLAEQFDRLADEIVEIDRALKPFRLGIECREAAARLKPGAQNGRKFGAAAQREQVLHAIGNARGIAFIARLYPEHLGRKREGFALFVTDDAEQIGEHLRAQLRIGRAPFRDHVGLGEALYSGDLGIGGANAADAFHVEGIICAGGDNRLLDIAFGHAECRTDVGRDIRAEIGHGGGDGRAVHKESFGAALPQPAAERLHRLKQRFVTAVFRTDQHVRQHGAGEQLFLARLHRSETGDKPGLDRETGKQRLAKAVDRLDAQPRTAGVEHAGKERTRHRAALWPMILTQRHQIARQFGIGQAHPMGEPRMDAIRHFGGARLGEGEAEDRRRIGPAQEQAHHAGGEDVRLAGAGRSRKPDLRLRIGGEFLIAAQGQERFYLSHRGHTIRRDASADHNRHKAHIRDGALP